MMLKIQHTEQPPYANGDIFTQDKPYNGTRECSIGDHYDLKYIFGKYDKKRSGNLDMNELTKALSEGMNIVVTYSYLSEMLDELDKDGNGTIDFRVFLRIVTKIQDDKETSCDFGNHIARELVKSRKNTAVLLQDIYTKISPYQSILCIQGEKISKLKKAYPAQDNFVAKYAPTDMRCLALVSHNGMKATMRDFVVANKTVLKKFQLTGTQSTMQMLNEVFDGETDVIFGPICQSGPLGGDAELVALMCCGRLGGMLFFQDPMTSHPHQSDIDCLCRQAVVHNTMIAYTPSTALMLIHVLRSALEGDGKPELIPSFFFSLQSPVVKAYKDSQNKEISRHSLRSVDYDLNEDAHTEETSRQFDLSSINQCVKKESTGKKQTRLQKLNRMIKANRC